MREKGFIQSLVKYDSNNYDHKTYLHHFYSFNAWW